MNFMVKELILFSSLDDSKNINSNPRGWNQLTRITLKHINSCRRACVSFNFFLLISFTIHETINPMPIRLIMSLAS